MKLCVNSPFGGMSVVFNSPIQENIDTGGMEHLFVSDEAVTDNMYVHQGSLVAIPPKPSSKCNTFDFSTGLWVDESSLADIKAAQWAKVKQSRTAAEYAGFTWDGSVFDSDAISQARITGAVTLAQMSGAFSIGWTLADNTTRTLNQMDMLQVGGALGAHVAAQFAKGVTLRQQIEDAQTKEAVEAVTW